MLWWIGNIIFVAVIIPVVIMILISVLTPIKEIRYYADDIAEHGGLFGPHLEATSELGQTRELVKEVNNGIVAYIQALDRIR
jgi:type IV secretory pathway component VirB8